MSQSYAYRCVLAFHSVYTESYNKCKGKHKLFPVQQLRCILQLICFHRYDTDICYTLSRQGDIAQFAVKILVVTRHIHQSVA